MDTYGSKFVLLQRKQQMVFCHIIMRCFITTYLDSNKEIIFFRNDVAVGWSAIQNDTPVGEGGKEVFVLAELSRHKRHD